MKKLLLTPLVSILLTSSVSFGEEPALPMGLGGSLEPSLNSVPALPMGLGGLGSSVNEDEESQKQETEVEPSLLMGLVVERDEDEDIFSWATSFLKNGVGKVLEHKVVKNIREEIPLDFTGFIEARGGLRTQNDVYQKDASLGELRAQFQTEHQFENVTANLTADFLYDPVADNHKIDLENGDGFIDLREASLSFRPTSEIDMKIGRQILTWGTGDLLFINDLFPKDWNSFFIGRDEEYLKAPSDSIKTSYYSDVANLDVVYTPKFEGDRFIDGRRLSYFNGNSGSLAGRNNIILADGRNDYFKEDELALRVNKVVNTVELALYYYNGYWKTPEGYNATSLLFEYPELQVFGASARAQMLGGIANAEVGYYDSVDDKTGTNPNVRNSEYRFLLGYEREVMPELTASAQYYLEHMDNYRSYVANLPGGAFKKDEDRHLFTVRLTKLMMNQNLTLSLFNFYSPSDEDGYVRARANYKIDDNWQAEIGGNYFYGNAHQSFFGQFENDSNIYMGLRYSF